MENFLQRFPGVGIKIFKKLDNQNLTKSKKVCRSWNDLLNRNKLIWIRMIEKYQESHIEFKKDWESILINVPYDTVKQIATSTEKFYKSRTKQCQFQNSPMHILAEQEHLPLFEFAFERVARKNPNPATKEKWFHTLFNGCCEREL